MSILPDGTVFADFKRQCLSKENWDRKYDKNGMEVLVEVPPANKKEEKKDKNVLKIHKIKCKMAVGDVSAATMYDVLLDSEYRKEWDTAMLESRDIARLSDNADVGYYSWICPRPIKNRDVVSLRSWQVTETEYIIVNFSVKHTDYPPRKDCVRAISIITGYLIEPTGPNSCNFTYLSQADPKGALPKWAVNKASQVLAPKVMKNVRTAGQGYQAWKKKQKRPNFKPWLHPEQSELKEMDPALLSIQKADSLENVDESNKVATQDGEDSS